MSEGKLESGCIYSFGVDLNFIFLSSLKRWATELSVTCVVGHGWAQCHADYLPGVFPLRLSNKTNLIHFYYNIVIFLHVLSYGLGGG